MHEAKFLMGAIAGAMSEHNRLAYIADYPIYGSIANINAFALGAQNGESACEYTSALGIYAR